MATTTGKTKTPKIPPARQSVDPVELGLLPAALTAAPDDPPALHVRAKLDQQLRALLEHEQVARADTDPEGVHQMRVAVRRLRAALRAGADLGPAAERLAPELRWLGGVLGAVRDLDVQLAHLRAQAADFEPAERDAVERLLLGLRADRRRARQRMLTALRGERYTALLAGVAAAARTEIPSDSTAETTSGEPVSGKDGKTQRAANLLELITRPYRALTKAARALATDPPDDDLHALRIRGKRLRYAAELAAPAGGKPVRKLIEATKRLQDVLGDHQDAVQAEQEIRRLLSEMDDPAADVAFAAGRLVERQRGRRADSRASWRATMSEVDSQAHKVLSLTVR